MKNEKIIIAYPGLGKSSLASQIDIFEDISSRKFRDADFLSYGKNYNYRGSDIVNFNQEYPNNLIEFINKKLIDNKTLLFAFKPKTIELLESLKLDYVMVLSNEKRLEKLKQDYIQRGDSEKYINKNRTTRYKDALVYTSNIEKKVIFLKEREYLKDII